MGRQSIVAAMLTLLLAAGLVCAQVPGGVPVPGEPNTVGDPRPQRMDAQPRVEHERSIAEANPNSPAPQASQNMPLSNVDGRTVAIYSILWLLAIVLAVTAILRAEYTDRYHEVEKPV